MGWTAGKGAKLASTFARLYAKCKTILGTRIVKLCSGRHGYFWFSKSAIGFIFCFDWLDLSLKIKILFQTLPGLVISILRHVSVSYPLPDSYKTIWDLKFSVFIWKFFKTRAESESKLEPLSGADWNWAPAPVSNLFRGSVLANNFYSLQLRFQLMISIWLLFFMTPACQHVVCALAPI